MRRNTTTITILTTTLVFVHYFILFFHSSQIGVKASFLSSSKYFQHSIRIPSPIGVICQTISKEELSYDKIPQIKQSRRANIKAREIWSILEQRYPQHFAIYSDDQNNHTTNITTTATSATYQVRNSSWKKTKTYIYHVTSVSSKLKSNHLQINQVIHVLDFLDATFANSSSNLNDEDDNDDHSRQSIVPIILQSIPRILRKNVNSYLDPTVKFLKDLYGHRFHEAIQRNPNLLLSSGIGYNHRPLSSNYNNDSSHNHTQYYHDQQQQQQQQMQDISSFLIEQNIGITSKDIMKIKEKNPAIFQLSIPEKVHPVVSYLLSLCGCNTIVVENMNDDIHNTHSNNDILYKNRQTVGKIIKANANILNLSIQDNLIPKIKFLQQEFGFKSQMQLIPILQKCPAILALSLEDNIRPTVAFLKQLLLLLDHPSSQEEIISSTTVQNYSKNSKLESCLLTHPQIIALSKDNLQKKVTFFNKIDESSIIMNDNGHEQRKKQKSKKKVQLSLAAKIALKAPSVYSLSLEGNIIPTVKCLSRLWQINVNAIISQDDRMMNKKESVLVDMNSNQNKNLSKILGDYPSILTLSLEGNIIPTLNFYNRTGYVTLDQDGNNLGESYLPPRYISTSLYNRLMPRWHFYSSKFGIRDDPSSSITNPPLYVIAGLTDKDFCARLSVSEEEFKNYKKHEIPALKFRSQFETWLKTGRPIDTPPLTTKRIE